MDYKYFIKLLLTVTVSFLVIFVILGLVILSGWSGVYAAYTSPDFWRLTYPMPALVTLAGIVAATVLIYYGKKDTRDCKS